MTKERKLEILRVLLEILEDTDDGGTVADLRDTVTDKLKRTYFLEE